ncbi:MAG: MoxR family ATPase [Bacteroidales bacterium]|nr:MoxR family ATPase [Bacteroidales bacterium]
MDIAELNRKIEQESAFVDAITSEISKVIVGQKNMVRRLVMGLLANGHILLEGVPGLAKTQAITALAKCIDAKFSRIQFTPDLLPADIVGTMIYSPKDESFSVKKGPIFSNFVLADEINRTSPKTQSALLEVMEEQKVTIEGETRDVPNPFVVMATQNPKGSAGTQLLPEAQIDRFMICVSMGYPNLKDEVEILKGKSVSSTTNVYPVLSKEQLMKIKEEVEAVHVSDKLYAYIAMLSVATREHSYIELGLSPRGSIACAKMAKAWAYLKGRNYVLPEDVVDIFLDVAKHRIVLNTKARVARVSERAVLEEILSQVKQPASYMQKVEYSV